MGREVITDRQLASLAKQAKSWPEGQRKILHDAVVPGAAVRVYSGGDVSLGMIARFPLHPKNPTFRKTADYTGPGSLPAWRGTVRTWHELIGRGIDPKIEIEREKATALRAQQSTFTAVWSAFWDSHASKLVKAKEAERAGAAFLRLWGPRPAAEIQPREIAAYIREVGKRTPDEARNRLGHLRRCFSWAIGTSGFGLESNPCRELKPADLIGKKRFRDRILSEPEIRRVWSACEGLGHPYGHLTRFLLLTGQRVSECAGMRWEEIDFHRAVWTIPAPRMKGGDRAHVVPLAPDASALLRSVPRWGGAFVFTSSEGKRPVTDFSRVKRLFDQVSGVTGWRYHDLRRTMRSGLSALPIEDRVREAMIAHAQPGLHAVYNLYDWLDEKRRGFELWEQRLRGILSPTPPAEIADFATARERRAIA